MVTRRRRRLTYATAVLMVAGLLLAAFGLSFALVDIPADGSQVAPNFYWIWTVFFLVVGSIHLVAGIGVGAGRRWGLWLGMTIVVGGSLLGAWTLARALSHITRYMDVPGTVGLAVVTGLYAVAAWSLLSSRQGFTRQEPAIIRPVAPED